jgi:hypothetical protein
VASRRCGIHPTAADERISGEPARRDDANNCAGQARQSNSGWFKT